MSVYLITLTQGNLNKDVRNVSKLHLIKKLKKFQKVVDL